MSGSTSTGRSRHSAPSRRAETARGGRPGSPLTGPLSIAVLPVLAALLLALVAWAPGQDDDSRASAETVAVGESAYACAGAPSLQTGQVAPGEEARARALPGGDVLDGAADPQRWVAVDLADLEGEPEAVAVAQRGERSGPVGFAHGRLPGSDGGGLVVGPCSDVVDDAWYTGLGSGEGRDSRLVLSNLGRTPAIADIRLWSPSGPVEAVSSEGVVVEPGESREIALTDLAAGEPELAVRVERRRGALAVSAIDVASGAISGSELPTSAMPPARRLTVPGVPGGDDARTLQLVNPGDSTARVRVEALGAEGPFVPEGLDAVRVEAGSTTSVELPESIGEEPVGLRLTAEVPVAAGVRVDSGGDDIATVPARGPWRGDAVVPLAGGLPDPELALTAAGSAGRVEVEAFDADLGSLGSVPVQVSADQTVAVALAEELDLAEAAFLVVRQDDGGSVAGAVTYRQGDRAATMALTAAPRDALVPPVRFGS